MDRDYWFSRKEKKSLHNIDTFYYSVKLANDFTEDTEDMAVLSFRRAMQQNFGDCMPFAMDNVDAILNYRYGTFARFYNIHIECPELYDIFIASVVPEYGDAGYSVTSEIVVQLRSKFLWEVGAHAAFKKSYQVIKELCEQYGLDIVEVKENRLDFCWHTNMIQNPEVYFNRERMEKMQVSRFSRVKYEYAIKSDSFESDYIAFGKRLSGKCYLRIYLKTKEVVEEGYKSFFFYTWFFNGLISRYDLYVLEEAYKQRSWRYVDIARLKFLLEHDDTVTPQLRSDIVALIQTEPYNYNAISKLADELTPQITKILNVEYQIMRRMTKSFCLLPLKDLDKNAPAYRIYEVLYNRRLITDYLTHDTFRLVDRKSDSNKSRCDYTDFWKRLRATKQVDVHLNKRQLKLVRDYSSKLDLQIRKTKAMRSVTSAALLVTQNPESSPFDDMTVLLNLLNDNDIRSLNSYRYRRYRMECNRYREFDSGGGD